jgi:hypothetical protein
MQAGTPHQAETARLRTTNQQMQVLQTRNLIQIGRILADLGLRCGATKIETSFGFGDFDGGDAGFDGFGDSAG